MRGAIKREAKANSLLPPPPHRPFHRGTLRPHVALEHDLLRLSDLAGAEVDALGEAQHRALGAQAPPGAARKPQQGGTAVLRQRGLHGWVQVEADGEAL